MRKDWPVWAAMALGVLMLAACWPGIAEYDSVEQYRQALAGRYDDWHPPAMAWLWAQLHAAFGGGAAPMFVVQAVLYWLGLGLIATRLARIGKPLAAGAVLALGALPVFVVWQITVLKDAQALGALLAATGIVAWWRLGDRPVPWAGLAVAGLLFCYAALVRANALFAVVPLVVMLAQVRRWPMRVALILAGMLVVLAVTPPIDTGIFGAAPSGVKSTQPLYDLSGIAVRVADPTDTGLPPRVVTVLRRDRCVKAFFWDSLGEGACADAIKPLSDLSTSRLYLMLANAALHHPLAYAAQRVGHLNSTERWLVPVGWPSAWADPNSESNTLELRDPMPVAIDYVTITRPLSETPLAWPVAWLAVALGGLAIALRRAHSPLRDLALALLVSAVAMEASFAVISIASDLRYHLWSMMAAGLAVILLCAERRPARRTLAIGGLMLALVIAGGGVSRLVLPHAPIGYPEMLAS